MSSNESDISEIKLMLADITKSLMELSEANGCALDALLSLLAPLGSRGILTQEECKPYMDALKKQHSTLISANQVISNLIVRTGIEQDSPDE